MYPGWIMRLYLNTEKVPSDILCQLVCNHNNLDICDIKNIPEPTNDMYDTGNYCS